MARLSNGFPNEMDDNDVGKRLENLISANLTLRGWWSCMELEVDPPWPHDHSWEYSG